MALGAGPFVFDTGEQHKIRVVVVARGIPHPWSLAFLPDGNMLITERGGRLRTIRDGVLDPQPIAGIPKVNAVRNGGLLRHRARTQVRGQRQLVYFTYTKPGDNGKFATALARGRFDRGALTEVRDLVCRRANTTVLGGSAPGLRP